MAGHSAPGTFDAMEFRRINDLPPYVFTIIDGLKSEAAAGRARRHRPRLRQPRHPLARHRRRQAGRGGPQPPQPPLLRQPGHPEAARGRRRPLPASLRRRARPRHRGHQHHRRQGGLLPPDVGAAPAGRRRARAVALVPDPHLGAVLRRRRRPRGAAVDRQRLLRERAGGLRVLVAQAPGDRAVVPAQPDDHVRRPRLHAADRRLRPRARASCSCTTSPTPRSPSTATCRRRSSRPTGPRSAPSSCTR